MVEFEGDPMEKDTQPTSKYPDYCRTIQVTDAKGGIKELVLPASLDLDRPKRARTTFSISQLERLENEFDRNPYLVGKERTALSKALVLTETQIKVWFQNRRTKQKKDKERDEIFESNSKTPSTAKSNIFQLFPQTTPLSTTCCEPRINERVVNGITPHVHHLNNRTVSSFSAPPSSSPMNFMTSSHHNFSGMGNTVPFTCSADSLSQVGQFHHNHYWPVNIKSLFS